MGSTGNYSKKKKGQQADLVLPANRNMPIHLKCWHHFNEYVCKEKLMPLVKFTFLLRLVINDVGRDIWKEKSGNEGHERSFGIAVKVVSREGQNPLFHPL